MGARYQVVFTDSGLSAVLSLLHQQVSLAHSPCSKQRDAGLRDVQLIKRLSLTFIKASACRAVLQGEGWQFKESKRAQRKTTQRSSFRLQTGSRVSCSLWWHQTWSNYHIAADQNCSEITAEGRRHRKNSTIYQALS